MAKSYKQKLEDGIIAAHEAGDIEGAQVLADELMKWQPKKIDPTAGMSTGDKFLAGVGKGFVDIGRGVGQRVGLVDQKSVDESKNLDAPLMDTTAGAVGNVAGQIAAFAPTAFIPGANTAVGATLIGAGTGALQPTATGESVGKNALYGAAGGFAGNRLGNYVGNKVSGRVAQNELNKATNSVRDATLREAQAAGYSVAPSQANAGVGSRLLEGLSGKYKTNQLASIRNQKITDSLARKSLGLSEDAPLTREVLQSVRQEAFNNGYAPVRGAGVIKTDKAYEDAIAGIESTFTGASKSFPKAKANGVTDVTDMVKVGEFDSGDAVDMIRLLRDQADSAYASGNRELGKASKSAAQAIEDQIERALSGANPGVLKNFREARKLIAKTHTVEGALKEGGGSINASKLASRVQAGKPLTDELALIGKFSNNFKDVTKMPSSGGANPLTALDFFGGVGTSGLAMAGGAPAALGLVMPAARVGARYGILSGPYQRAFATPSYGSAALNVLDKARPALPYAGTIGGGLLGANYQ
jgi:hypothetical protein